MIPNFTSLSLEYMVIRSFNLQGTVYGKEDLFHCMVNTLRKLAHAINRESLTFKN